MKYVGIIVICVVLGSCLNDGNCIITATNTMHIQFKTHRDHKTDTTIDIKAIYISGTAPDSASGLAPTTALKEILLPIDIHRDTTTFIFQYSDGTSNTLQVNYSGQTKIIAKDCGAFTYYQNLRVLYPTTDFKESQIKEFSTSLLVDPTLYAGSKKNPSAYAVNYQIFF